jgi:hypothetical protein
LNQNWNGEAELIEEIFMQLLGTIYFSSFWFQILYSTCTSMLLTCVRYTHKFFVLTFCIMPHAFAIKPFVSYRAPHGLIWVTPNKFLSSSVQHY